MKICKCIVEYFSSERQYGLKAEYTPHHSACRGLKDNEVKAGKLIRTTLECKTTYNPFKWVWSKI